MNCLFQPLSYDDSYRVLSYRLLLLWRYRSVLLLTPLSNKSMLNALKTKYYSWINCPKGSDMISQLVVC